ncbi:MAG: heme-binding beta-barrel domain-containing protein [Actinomycetaceae bacterium]|nr:heme-binding beta-barrel domain-containing protein [Actinomycetaceae bacterium]
MISLPSDVPTTLRPLAWIIGSWQGFGTRTRPIFNHTTGQLHAETTIEHLVGNIAFSISQTPNELVQHTQIFHAAPQDNKVVPMTLSADTALNCLDAAKLWWEEKTVWSVTHSRVATKNTPASARAECVSHGIVTFAEDAHPLVNTQWSATVTGPRIMMATHQGSAKPLSSVTRSFGLVGGELMIVQDLATATQELSEWCVRMEKISVDNVF